MTTYYDIVLGIIPLTFIGSIGTGLVAGIATTTAIAIGATVSLLFVGHALFVNPPIDTASAEGLTSASNKTDPSGSVAEFAD